LVTHPGVATLTALAFGLIIGTPERFARSKELSSYQGLVPTEDSSGERRHLGHISKQGNTTGGPAFVVEVGVPRLAMNPSCLAVHRVLYSANQLIWR